MLQSLSEVINGNLKGCCNNILPEISRNYVSMDEEIKMIEYRLNKICRKRIGFRCLDVFGKPHLCVALFSLNCRGLKNEHKYC